MENQTERGTVKGLLEFLDQLVNKGRATSGSVLPLKTAIKQIFKTVEAAEDWEDTDVRKLDIEEYSKRFENLTIGNYNQDSLKTYRARFRKAVDWYNKFLDSPGWTPSLSNSSKVKRSGLQNASHGNSSKKTDRPGSITGEDSLVGLEGNKQNLTIYPFPLRPGKFAYLYLPPDLSMAEATRISHYLVSLCLDASFENTEK
jgi:hypothetical protein